MLVLQIIVQFAFIINKYVFMNAQYDEGKAERSRFKSEILFDGFIKSNNEICTPVMYVSESNYVNDRDDCC